MEKEYFKRLSRQRILGEALERGDITLTSGRQTSWKFEFDNIRDGSEELLLCVEGMKSLIRDNFNFRSGYPARKPFDAIATIATGANRLGPVLADEFDVPHIPTIRHDAHERCFAIDPTIDVSEIKTALLIDDVFTSGESAREVEKLFADERIAIVGLATILDRSDPQLHEFMDDKPAISVMRYAE